MLEYKTIEGEYFTEWEINKSRFLTYIKHVETEIEAQEFISSIKKKHFDARHNCSAYIIGERSGTAGAPMLEVLKKNELSDIVVVVTRYFGGIKLGAGGLIRAYGKSVTLGLDVSTIVKKSIFNCYKLDLNYDLLGSFENYLHQKEIRIQNKDYSDIVSFTLLLAQNDSENILKDITNLSAGRIKIEELEPVYLNIPLNTK